LSLFCIRFANSELVAAKEKLVMPGADPPLAENCQWCGGAAPIKTTKESVKNIGSNHILILRALPKL